MDRNDQDRPSIFSKPDVDDVEPATPDTDPGPHGPMRSRPAEEGDFIRGSGTHRAPDRRVLLLGGMGLVIILLAGVIGFAVLGGDDDVAVVSPPPSGTPPATQASTAPSDPSPDPTVSPEPTPEPTPAGPPAQVAVASWATVTLDEIDVRDAPDASEASVYRLVRGAIVHVAEGPTAVDGENWYRVVSLGGATGWASSGPEAAPALETIARDPTINECGQVRRAVFTVESGAATPNEVLRVGDFALPASAFDDVTLGGAELVRGMGDEMCFTARLGSDGQPELSTQFSVSACGHATRDGLLYRLEPTDDDDIPLASQVMEPTVVHPTLLEGGPADNRMSTNIATVVSMLTNDGTSGCLHINVTQRADAIDVTRSASARQCSVVNVYNQDSLKLSPAAGGPEAWIKLNAANFQRGLFPLEEPIDVSVDAYARGTERSVYAWPGDPCG
jgi:Bacterial SH3 domain